MDQYGQEALQFLDSIDNWPAWIPRVYDEHFIQCSAYSCVAVRRLSQSLIDFLIEYTNLMFEVLVVNNFLTAYYFH